MSIANAVWTPADVFYVVRSEGAPAEQKHRVSSVLFEMRPQAEAELVRLKAQRPDLDYRVWKSTTYVQPRLWLYPVVMADGSVVPPSGSAPRS
jgi:hypothetical protein